MAVRPIDANELYRIEKLLDTDIVRQDKVALNLLEQVLYDIQHVPTLTPPNEALTIEELREMNGEPVWIVDVGPHKWYGPGWAIVDRDNCLVRTVKNWNAVFFESYGERWLAYRRPPEVQS